ncbi:hypothetical protein KJ865_12600, partial [Myxococcota bacterium]|nr:hypothetical protein [Myxococcota bacterium]
MKRFFPLAALLLTVGLFGVLSCSPDGGNNNNFNSGNNTNNANNSVCTEGQEVCFNNIIQLCQNNAWINETVCGMGSEPPICDNNNGSPICANCVAGGTTCGEDNNVHVCDAGGNVGLVSIECDSSAGEQCVEANGVANCDSPCIRAASTKSYRGCDYWLVSMANPGLGATTDWLGADIPQYDFDEDFGVVVDNSQNEGAALITIMNGTQSLKNESIPAGETRVFLLPYNLGLRQAEAGQLGTHADIKSGIYRAANAAGGFHLTSSLPVTVYQFNPYNYEKGSAYSYSNDASLILPTAVLSTNYLVMA